MTKIHVILERLRANEALAEKFHQVEIRILATLDLRDLFESLLKEIEAQFDLPYVWLSFSERNEVSGLLAPLEASNFLKERLTTVDRSVLDQLLGDTRRPTLANRDLKPFYRLLPPNQKYFLKSIAVTPIYLDGEIIGCLNQADATDTRFQPGMDTTHLERLAHKLSLCLSNATAHEKLKFLAYHDPLTGLLNRRVLETVLKREITRAQRYSSQLSIVFIDLDQFKQINDTYGHDRGDEVLRHLAEKLSAMVRDSDIVARYAGDEFIAVLPETSPQNAAKLMKRMQQDLVRNPLTVGEATIPLAISFGVASISDLPAGASVDPSELLKQADRKLLREKKSKFI